MNTTPLPNSPPAGCRFTFKTFQKQDLARAAMHDGLILSWDTGLWKTGASYVWPLLKCGHQIVAHEPNPHFAPLVPTRGPQRLAPKKPCLMVVPGDLHQQTALEGVEKFNIETIPLTSQDDFMRLTRQLGHTGPLTVPPGFYITSYTQLTTNNVSRIPDPLDWPDPIALMQLHGLKQGDHLAVVPPQGKWDDTRPDFETTCHFFAWRSVKWKSEYFRLSVTPEDTIKTLVKAFDREVAGCQKVRDLELRAEMVQLLQESFDVLKHLMCARPDPQFKQLAAEQQNFIIRHFLADKFKRYEASVGTVKEYPVGELPADFYVTKENPDPRPKRRIECIYSPSLADLCYEAFECVTVDEGVKMKGEDTYVGLGVRKMNPKYRMVLTATPVKNRLPDIFRLAYWATGGNATATARWPYRDDSEERQKFTETFMVSERNVTKEKASQEAGGRGAASGRYKRMTAEVCNIHRLWKLLGPIVLRRRKDDCGEAIVPKIRRVIRAEMGTLQQQVYQYHLNAKYLEADGKTKAVGAQLQALRMAAADPSSDHLIEKPGRNTKPCECTKPSVSSVLSVPSSAELPPGAGGTVARKNCAHCKGTGEIPLPSRSGQAYIPKMAAVLEIVKEILERKEQVVIGSAFNDPLDCLSRWLTEADIRHIKLDGRMSQKKRGLLSKKFKQGRLSTDPEGAIPVTLAGVESMAEGHNWPAANNVILVCYSWAYDKFIQFINRVHRMTSLKDVNMYVVVCHGTIDLRLESLIQDKGDAAELVLDGRLIGERTEEVNLAELLKIAHAEFAALEGSGESAKTIDEALIHAQWPGLREQLRTAMRAWAPAPPPMVGRDSVEPIIARAARTIPVTNQTPVTHNPEVKIKHMKRNQPQKIQPLIPVTHDLGLPPLPAGQRPQLHTPAPPVGRDSIELKPQTLNPQPSTPPASDWRARLKARVANIQKNTSYANDPWRKL